MIKRHHQVRLATELMEKERQEKLQIEKAAAVAKEKEMRLRLEFFERAEADKERRRMESAISTAIALAKKEAAEEALRLHEQQQQQQRTAYDEELDRQEEIDFAFAQLALHRPQPVHFEEAEPTSTEEYQEREKILKEMNDKIKDENKKKPLPWVEKENDQQPPTTDDNNSTASTEDPQQQPAPVYIVDYLAAEIHNRHRQVTATPIKVTSQRLCLTSARPPKQVIPRTGYYDAVSKSNVRDLLRKDFIARIKKPDATEDQIEIWRETVYDEYFRRTGGRYDAFIKEKFQPLQEE